MQTLGVSAWECRYSEKLVAGGADVLYAANGITALHAAAQEGEIDVVMELVEFGKVQLISEGQTGQPHSSLPQP